MVESKSQTAFIKSPVDWGVLEVFLSISKHPSRALSVWPDYGLVWSVVLMIAWCFLSCCDIWKFINKDDAHYVHSNA